MIRNLRKWAFFIAAGIAVIGCGGGGNDSTSSTNTGTTTGGSSNQLTPNLSATYGTIDFTYLTGQLRAPGDLTGVVNRVEVEDSVGIVRSILETPRRLPLASYVSSTISLNVPFTGQSSRQFASTDLDFFEFYQEDNTGGTPTFTKVNVASPSPFPLTIPTRIRVLPGRNTSLPILLDDAMFSYDPVKGVAFDKDRFNLRNNLGTPSAVVQTFFSDYVAFDLRNMAANLRPTLSTGGLADFLFVSGDNYALGKSTAATSGAFEVLTLDSTAPIVGTYGNEGSSGGRTTPGTYTLRQLDPLQLDDSVKATITSMQGVWKDSTRAFTNVGKTDFILFPTSRNEAPNGTNGNGLKPDVNLEVALVVRNDSGQVTDFYYGQADLDKKTFTAYSLKGISVADASNEISGTLGTYLNGSGSATSTFDLVRSGSYSFSANKPASFPATGKFVIYRK